MILRPYKAAVCPARGGGCTGVTGPSTGAATTPAGDVGGVTGHDEWPLLSELEIDIEFGVSGLDPAEIRPDEDKSG
jgi:hypothetical protein